ncbi:hypothetical protein SPRG_13525 [Saprolegnia parasitica CBS 223.65]|uniref:EF-hand domain-containing protein n=1 Tax=Saprolegnia parasitica (strain CBS 223.65) TaxID=695850 RepID=A0A067BRA3_SAPPC|nr:hypothetical protein SPRG_13525 [Saprolegnia parasitica CBS 223.65]KDO20773.1 hypothetical protein SPRG_13525 [Saprolegnia parasitica CBS 223.65]|eukprot:XP_012208511.1 hypothetical protein SPRG_13525 [Saprolegnia parasitica CBS 223.65]
MLYRHATLGRVQSVPSLGSPSPLDLGEPEVPASLASSKSEKDRLFGQLHGDSTWKKSDVQMARETAWEVEAVKYKARMDRIFKPQPAATTQPDRSDVHSPAGPQILESLASDHRETLSSLSTTLPRLSSNQLSQMSFDDKDNWSVNSLNRQKLVYRHLFTENSRNLRNPATKKQPKLLLETIDTTPSAFVLQHLGPDIPRKPTPKPRRRHVPTLAASASAPTLSKVVKLHRASSLRLEKMLASAQSLDSIIHDGIPTTSKATPVAGSPEKTLARFEAMIADRPLKAASQKTPASNPPRPGTCSVTHVVLPAVTTTSTTTNNNSSSLPKPVKALTSPAPSVKDMVDADRRILLQPLFGPYPRDHVLEVCRIFVRIDVDNSGVIETSEFVDKLSQLEGDEWRDALNTVFRDLDQDHNGRLDMPELLKAMFPRASNRVQDEMLQFARLAVAAERHEKAKVRELSPKALADITALFHLFDVDNSGAIEPVELLREFKANERRFYDKHPERSIADRWQLADIVKIFQQYDANANASLELDEFIELFRDSF